jgi:hypothetical protein
MCRGGIRLGGYPLTWFINASGWDVSGVFFSVQLTPSAFRPAPELRGAHKPTYPGR